MDKEFFSRYPVPPDSGKEFNIVKYGAVGDGKKLNTIAIQKALDDCGNSGGGKVIIPKGSFMTGTIHIKSNTHLLVEEGAEILGSPNKVDYPYQPPYNTRYRDIKNTHRALVCASGQKNIMVSGQGTINGNARSDSKGDFQDTGNNVYRPTLFWMEDCTDIIVKEVTFRQSLMWTSVYESCKHLWIDKVRITENYFYNADGIDILDCEDFLIENCDINADDDGICLKSGASYGCNRGVVRNNRVRSLCNAIKMGTGSGGGFRNILIENCEVWQTVISGIALQIVDGGIMENIIVRNITMKGVGTPVNIRLGDRNRGYAGQKTVQTGIIRNVYLGNITATVNEIERYNEPERQHHPYLPYTSSLTGIPGHYIEDVTIENVTVTILGGFPVRKAEESLRPIDEKSNKYPENRMFGVLPSHGFYLRHIRGIKMSNINIITRQEDELPVFMLEDVHDAGFTAIRGENKLLTPLISLQPDCSNIRLG